MNKEYMYLSNDEVLVTNEDGHIIKRKVENDNMDEILQLENNLEELENVVKEKNNVLEKEQELFKCRKFMSFISFVILLSTLGITGAMALSEMKFAGVLLAGFGVTLIYTSISKYFEKISVRNIKKIKQELLNADNLKNNMESQIKKLSLKKDRTLNNNRNRVFTLKTLEETRDKILSQIDNSDISKGKSKVKSLTR